MGLGYARWLQNMLRIYRNIFWDHLSLANIGNSLFDLQISILGTTIRPRNLPFRPGVSQETFWILDSCFWILDLGSWILYLVSWIMNCALWIMSSQLWIMNYELWIMIDDDDLWLWLMIDDYDWWLWLMMIDDYRLSIIY